MAMISLPMRRTLAVALGLFSLISHNLVCGEQPSNYRAGTETFVEVCGSHWKRKVHVDSISLSCKDVEEEKYYDSISCRPGDLATTYLNFRLSNIPEDYPIDLMIQTTYFGYSYVVTNLTNLCYLPYLYYLGPTEEDQSTTVLACPAKDGYYELRTQFTMPQFVKEMSQFTPDMLFTFYDAMKGDVIGCAETGLYGRLHSARYRERVGERLLICFVVLIVATFALFLIGDERHRRAAISAVVNKKAAIIRRYHYRRRNLEAGNDFEVDLNPNGDETDLNNDNITDPKPHNGMSLYSGNSMGMQSGNSLGMPSNSLVMQSGTSLGMQSGTSLGIQSGTSMDTNSGHPPHPMRTSRSGTMNVNPDTHTMNLIPRHTRNHSHGQIKDAIPGQTRPANPGHNRNLSQGSAMSLQHGTTLNHANTIDSGSSYPSSQRDATGQ